MESTHQPLHSTQLVGHQSAAQAITDAEDSGELHHAWMLHGPQGVGKATLAYHAARYILTRPVEAGGPSLFGDELPAAVPEKPLQYEIDSPEVQRMMQGAHADLLTIEPTHIGEDGKEKAGFEIRMYQLRELQHFLGQTSAETGRRVVIIDSADDMNHNAANALLKMLEEPPKQTVFFLISHVPGRLLPTIASRCRKLAMKPLSEAEVSKLITSQLDGVDAFDPALEFAIRVSKGAVGQAITLFEQDAYKTYQMLLSILASTPKLDVISVQDFANAFGGKQKQREWDVMVELYAWLLSDVVRSHALGIKPPSQKEQELYAQLVDTCGVEGLLEAWKQTQAIGRDVEVWNLDRTLATQEMLAAL